MPKIGHFNSFTLCGSRSSFIVHRNTQEGGKLLKIKNAVSLALIEIHTQKCVKRCIIRNIARTEMQNLGTGDAGSTSMLFLENVPVPRRRHIFSQGLVNSQVCEVGSEIQGALKNAFPCFL